MTNKKISALFLMCFITIGISEPLDFDVDKFIEEQTRKEEERERMIEFSEENEDTIITKENDPYDSMDICPFPPEDLIRPCKCFADDKFRAHLICDLEDDIAVHLFQKLNKIFGCRREIYYLKLNMNGNNLTLDFNEDSFGNLRVTKFHLENVGMFSGSIYSGAFKESKMSLEEFIMEDSLLDPYNVNAVGLWEQKLSRRAQQKSSA